MPASGAMVMKNEKFAGISCRILNFNEGLKALDV
jgi:hypothetical protein